MSISQPGIAFLSRIEKYKPPGPPPITVIFMVCCFAIGMAVEILLLPGHFLTLMVNAVAITDCNGQPDGFFSRIAQINYSLLMTNISPSFA